MRNTKESGSVVFYSWIENQPSSLAIAVEGGGMLTKEPLKQVRFTKGRLETSDPEAIALLRKLISAGDNITEDHELFLSKVTKPEDQAKRIDKANEQLRKENERLKKLLGKKASASA